MTFTWTPGIGDPTIGGWVTVALYFAAAWSSLRTGTRLAGLGVEEQREGQMWVALALLFALLGLNKQLDLQSALTDLGRVLAYHGGWYEKRRLIQFSLIAVVVCVATLGLAAMLVRARRSPPATWIALIGVAFVAAFVVIRAASFHHVDELIGSRILGLKWNWVLEMSGILVFITGSTLRTRTNVEAPN